MKTVVSKLTISLTRLSDRQLAYDSFHTSLRYDYWSLN
jgi:hypothetical protein